MQRIKKLFTKLFPYDKLLHFCFGLILSLILSSFFMWWQSLLIVLSLAVSVELYDKYSGKGTPEIMDIVYALIGWGVVILLK